jgi:hypothetical protein
MRPHNNESDRKKATRRNIARGIAILAALSMGVGFIVPAMSGFGF